jgi:polysaccharide biosynthesis transport protein
MAASVDTSDKNETFRVIDEPNLPSTPVKPDRPMLTAAGVLAGVLLGFGMAFAREYIDPTLGTEDEAAAELKLPILTSIPEVKSREMKPRWKKKKGLALVPKSTEAAAGTPDGFSIHSANPFIRSIIMDPMTAASEQYRVLRARLSSLQKQRGAKTILVTSSIPNEGKTFAACALAGVLAQEPGKRVLLIDADLRTSQACHVLGLDPGDSVSGLFHFLNGTAKVEQLIKRCNELNLSFLPAGAIADKPAEVLSSPELASMLKDVAQIFDWIIIDAPPVLGLADANLIMPSCDTTLFVVSTRTHSELVKNSLQRIGREHLCGVLLNRVRQLKSYPYYYNRFYQKAAQQK